MLVDLVGLGLEFVATDATEDFVESLFGLTEEVESSTKNNRVDKAVIPSRCGKAHGNLLRQDVLRAEVVLDFGRVVLGFFTDFVVFCDPDFACFDTIAEPTGHEKNALDFFLKKHQCGLFLWRDNWVWIRAIQGFFQNENTAAAEAVRDNVILELVVHPAGSAAAEQREVGIANFDFATLSRALLKLRFVPDGSQKSDHLGVDVLAAEELFEFTDERAGLPVGNIFAVHFPCNLILGHVVDQRLARAGLWRNRNAFDQFRQPLGHIHCSGFPCSRISHQDDVEIREYSKEALRHEALLAQ